MDQFSRISVYAGGPLQISRYPARKIAAVWSVNVPAHGADARVLSRLLRLRASAN
jgi:hypothetical protein